VKLDTDIALRASLSEVGKRTDNGREACATIRWGLGANDGHVRGTATISALVLKAVPVEGINSAQVLGNTYMFNGQ